MVGEWISEERNKMNDVRTGLGRICIYINDALTVIFYYYCCIVIYKA